MEKKKLKGISITPNEDGTNEIKFDEMVDRLDEMYAKLDCTCIDIKTYKVGNDVIDIVMDDEAKINGKNYKYAPSVLIVDKDDRVCDAIFGKCFVCCGNNETGELESLPLDVATRVFTEGTYICKQEDDKEDKGLWMLIVHYCQ